VTTNLDRRWLGRVRRSRAKLAERLTSDAASGRVSRRDVIRGGTVVGLSAPLAGSMLAAEHSGSPRPAKARPSGAVTLDSYGQVAASSVLGIPEGGTGQTTAEAAFNALAPMTTTGDMVYDSAAALAARLPIGAESEHLLVVSGGVPGWVAGVVNAKAYGATGNGSTDTDDSAAIQNALNAVSGGIVLLPPGTYNVKTKIVVPWNNILAGSGPGTVVQFNGTGDAIRMYNSQTPTGDYATQADQSGGIRDLTVDGSKATAPATGIHIGDGLGYELTNVFIGNFTGSGSIGLHVDNSISWTEKMRARHVVTSNCATHVLMEQTGGMNSLAYSEYDIHMYIAGGQTGLTIQNGVNPYANRFWLTANVQPSTSETPATTFMNITGSDGAAKPNFSKIQDSLIFVRAETDADPNAASGTTLYIPQTIKFGVSGGSNVITNCFGEMIFEESGSVAWAASNAAPGNLTFRGTVNGDAALAAAQGTESVATPTLTNGAPQPNTTTANIQVIVSGGSVSSIQLAQGSGSPVTTGLTSGTFLLPPGGQITVNYPADSAPPSWCWLRAAT
jgi:hypothetical protein